MSGPTSTEAPLPPSNLSTTTLCVTSNRTRCISLIPYKFSASKQPALISATCNATSEENVPPLESDVGQVLAGVGRGGNTFNKNTPIGAILKTLRTRFSNDNWAVVLKSEILLHAIMRAGCNQFLLYLAGDLRGMLDINSFEDEEVGGVIVGYAKYLKTWMRFRKESTWFQNGMGRERNSNDWEKLSFDGVMDAIHKMLAVLEGVENITGGTNNDIVKMALKMVWHDCWLLAGVLKGGVEILVKKIFGQSRANARNGRLVCVDVREVAQRVSNVVNNWGWVGQNWEFGERLQYDNCGYEWKKMNFYIDGDCIGIDNDSLMEANRRCIEGGDGAVDKYDLQMVRCVGNRSPSQHDSGTAEVSGILVEGLGSGDWRVVLKSFGVVFYLLGDENGWLFDYLELRLGNGELGETGLNESIAGFQEHQEFITWCWEYMQRLVEMKRTVETETEIWTELECFVETMKWMVGLPVDEVARQYAIRDLVYEKVIVDCGLVFKRMTRKANEMCGVFFESQEIVDAQRMLDMYGRFVSVREDVIREDGLFSKMEKLDDCFRRPGEVARKIDIYTHMKMFVDLKMERNRAGEVQQQN